MGYFDGCEWHEPLVEGSVHRVGSFRIDHKSRRGLEMTPPESASVEKDSPVLADAE